MSSKSSGAKKSAGGRKKSVAKRQTGGPVGRMERVRVKTAKGRKLSSKLWLERQLNDPYVQAAQRDGYRSRAAYKLLELDEMHHLLKKGQRVVDLGAAPGGWTQIAVKAVGDTGVVLAVDINEMEPVAGAEVMQGDVCEEATAREICERLEGRADLVLSDMAPPSSGHNATDHLRIIGLVEGAYEIVKEILAPGGAFVAKVWQGGAEGDLLSQMKKDFKSIKHSKPKASRSGSAEMYLVATGYRGRD